MTTEEKYDMVKRSKSSPGSDSMVSYHISQRVWLLITAYMIYCFMIFKILLPSIISQGRIRIVKVNKYENVRIRIKT